MESPGGRVWLGMTVAVGAVLICLPLSWGDPSLEDEMGCFNNSITFTEMMFRTKTVNNSGAVPFNSDHCLEECFHHDYYYMGIYAHRYDANHTHHHLQCRCGNVPPRQADNIFDNECPYPCGPDIHSVNKKIEITNDGPERWCVQRLAEHERELDTDRILVYLTAGYKDKEPTPTSAQKGLGPGAVGAIILSLILIAVLVGAVYVYQKKCRTLTSEGDPILNA